MNETRSDLVRQGIAARQRRDGAQWDLGDLAATVETAYGAADLERYADEIGVDYDTLRDYRRVAVAFENGDRSPNLSWLHHRVLAARDDRRKWLAKAEANGWSVRQMQAEIEASQTVNYRLTSPLVPPSPPNAAYVVVPRKTPDVLAEAEATASGVWRETSTAGAAQQVVNFLRQRFPGLRDRWCDVLADAARLLDEDG